MNEPISMAAVSLKSGVNLNQKRLSLRQQSAPTFGNAEAAQQNENQTSKKDPLMTSPLRLCAYTNEVGAAVSPIPGIGPTLFKLSWVPALLYFGADIYDKYSKGEKGDYSEPSGNKAIQQSVFQGLASVLLPTGAVILGQRVVSRASSTFSKDKMDVRAKETILAELKRDINQDRLRHYRKEIDSILEKNSEASLEVLSEHVGIKKIKNELTENIYKDIKIETETLVQRKQRTNIFKRALDKIIGGKNEFEYLSRIKPEKFEEKIKPYLEKQVSELVDTRVVMQQAIDADGTFNANSKNLSRALYKKAGKILRKNMENRDIVDKTSFAVKECVLGKINKTALKLSTVKIAGGFISLALLAKPIDHFVENTVIEKYLSPRLREKNDESKLDQKA